MPNLNAAPQTSGHMIIDLTPGHELVEIDGYRIEQHVTALKLMFSAKDRHPVLLLDLLPSAVKVTGTTVQIGGDFRDFLLAHGWRAPD